METRTIEQRVELRADGDAKIITGYAAVFYRADDPGTQYPLWAGAVERVMPGAFDEALKSDDVRALFNHDENMLLGRNRSGTLALSIDDVGLRYDVTLDPEDDDHMRVYRKLQRGDVDGSSFGFMIRGRDGQSWTMETRDGVEIEVRELRNVQLFDVGPVVFPAYPSSTSGTRNDAYAEARSARQSWQERREQEQQEVDKQAALRGSYLRKAHLFLTRPLTPNQLFE